jgi:glycosyltransferase involved in cell wall biosynthesis
MTPDSRTPAKLSVVIPCYNAESYLAQALQSVLDQTHPVSEVVIVNDGSTDGSLALIQEWAAKYPELIRVFDQPNRGVAFTRTEAIRQASYTNVVTLDADDYLHPNAVEEWLRYAKKYPKYKLIYSDYYRINPDGEVTAEINKSKRRTDPLEGSILPTMLWENVVDGIAFVKRAPALEVGGYAVEGEHQRSIGEDILLGFRLLLAGYEIGYLQKPLFYYRDTPGSRSKDPDFGKHALTSAWTQIFRSHPEKMAAAYYEMRQWRAEQLRDAFYTLEERNRELRDAEGALEKRAAELRELRESYLALQTRTSEQDRMIQDLFTQLQSSQVALSNLQDKYTEFLTEIERARTYQQTIEFRLAERERVISITAQMLHDAYLQFTPSDTPPEPLPENVVHSVTPLSETREELNPEARPDDHQDHR